MSAQVDVIVATFTPCALAAKQATTTIPIVMAAVADPIAVGLVTSLARPGGNITGFSNMAAETAGKSVELFRDMLPSIHRVAALANPADPFTTMGLTDLTNGAKLECTSGNADHMIDNLGAARGRLPDAQQRERMAVLLAS